MKKLVLLYLLVSLWTGTAGQDLTRDKLPFYLEELSSLQFPAAVARSGGICLIPLGIIEKHGPHLPLGTDLFEAREFSLRAVKQEYAIVFPPYYFGQIFEAMHQPGTIAYSRELMWKLLEETCNELSRNGLKKIILVNGHGGNNSFLEYFCQSQLAEKKDYQVFIFQPSPDEETAEKLKALKKSKLDGHAGEEETSMMYVIRPDLVNHEAAKLQSGEDQARLNDLKFAYTGIWWYAKFPNHYAGDGTFYSRELGELLLNSDAGQLASLIRYLKKDKTVNKLQEEFYMRALNPIK